MLERIRVLNNSSEEKAAIALFGCFFAELEHHMDAEERLMCESGYPHAEYHASRHPEATDKLTELQKKLFGGDSVVMYVSISDMVHLLSEHIDHADMQFAQYYLSRQNTK